MGKSAKAPDYEAAAEATGQSSKEVTNMQTWANRPNQVTPWGSTSWEASAATDPSTGQPITQWTQNTSLTPEGQKALDDQFAITGGRSDLARQLLPRAGEEFGQEMDWSKYGDFQQGPQAGTLRGSLGPEATQVNPSARYYDEAGDALMNQFNARMEPKFARDTAALETQLRNRGFNPGDAGYDQALEDMRTSQNDAYSNAAFQATQLAGQEGSRMFGMDMGSRQQQMDELGFGNETMGAQFGLDTQQTAQANTLRQNQLAEEMQRRGFSLNEINALISGQQVAMPNMPGFNQASKSAGVDYTGAARDQYSADQDAANASNAFTNSVMNMAGGMIPSDRRLKSNIRRTGTLPSGLGWYSYDIFGQKAEGVMAQEAMEKFPGAVHKHPAGFLMVDYSKIS
jgi:hypothetical protein